MTQATPPTILVVDDIEANIDVLVSVLSQRFEVCVAMDGETALEILEEETPDLVLLDLIMPGMNGYEVLEKIREKHSPEELPVVLLSGNGEEEDLTRAQELGANDYLGKPFRLNVLYATIEAQLLGRV